ncbi:MAG: hypothetical protein VB018_13350 [Lachnospiraceae bacterium]|nr:hypothetical protein [Lachnospiraceae bacterium]
MTQEEMEKDITTLKVGHAKMDESLKSNHKRLDKIEDIVENINALTTSVHELALETKALRGDVNNVSNRVKELETKPGKRWDGVVDKIIITVVGVVVGYIMAGGHF